MHTYQFQPPLRDRTGHGDPLIDIYQNGRFYPSEYTNIQKDNTSRTKHKCNKYTIMTLLTKLHLTEWLLPQIKLTWLTECLLHQIQQFHIHHHKHTLQTFSQPAQSRFTEWLLPLIKLNRFTIINRDPLCKLSRNSYTVPPMAQAILNSALT